MTNMRELLCCQRETCIVLNLTVYTKCLGIHNVSGACLLYYFRYESQIRNADATWGCIVLRADIASL